VLADSKLTSWLQIVADNIPTQDWKDERGESTLCALLSLPRHLLHAAMSKLRLGRVASKGAALCRYIDRLPVVLHGALVSSLIGSQGELALSGLLSPLLIAALNRSQLCGPEVLSLDLTMFQREERSLLANSVASHTSLTSLSLSFAKSSSVQALKESELMHMCQNLPTALKRLRLPGMFKAQALDACGRALWHLKSLESLCMGRIQLQAGPDSKTSRAAGVCFLQVCSGRNQYCCTL
jgi:hypothetical protein